MLSHGGLDEMGPAAAVSAAAVETAEEDRQDQ
jgi:hypothetical protein